MEEDTELKICDKRRYESKEEALETISFLEQSKRCNIGALDYYQCHICHNIPLTSK